MKESQPEDTPRVALRQLRLKALVAPLLLSLAAGVAVRAQPRPLPPVSPTAVPQRTAAVRGNIRDSSNAPISYATIQWGEARQTVHSSDSGSFEISGLPPGKTSFSVRRLGYVPVNFDLTLRAGFTKPVVISMVAAPEALSAVSVETKGEADHDEMRAARFRATGFFDRMAARHGYFIPPREVEDRRPSYVSDLMYTVPGVVMVGTPHSSALRYMSSVGQCRLKVYLDGQAAQEGDDFVAGSDIKAIEVYKSMTEVPDAFMPSPLKGYCGSIIVWTK